LKTIAKLFQTPKKSQQSIRNSGINSLLLPSKIFQVMARVCQVTGKTPIGGNKVSHSNIKTKRRFLPNLQTKKFFLAEENKWITLKLTTDAIRTINKNGLYNVVKGLRAQGQHI
jgi:large subunit ribosomal protein L28